MKNKIRAAAEAAGINLFHISFFLGVPLIQFAPCWTAQRLSARKVRTYPTALLSEEILRIYLRAEKYKTFWERTNFAGIK